MSPATPLTLWSLTPATKPPIAEEAQQLATAVHTYAQASARRPAESSRRECNARHARSSCGRTIALDIHGSVRVSPTAHSGGDTRLTRPGFQVGGTPGRFLRCLDCAQDPSLNGMQRRTGPLGKAVLMAALPPGHVPDSCLQTLQQQLTAVLATGDAEWLAASGACDPLHACAALVGTLRPCRWLAA
jgi:hypothetical protein